MGASQQIKRLAFSKISNPPYTKVSYGSSYIDACTSYVVEELQARRVYVIASNSMSKMTDYVQKLEQALGPGWAGTSTGIRAHTYLSDLIPITKEVIEKKVDCIITMGGSSLADGAQIISYAAANNILSSPDQNEDAALSRLLEFRTNSPSASTAAAPAIPLVFIPTSLSGGEYSQYGGGTDPRTQEKIIFAHYNMYPRLIILDPTVTSSTPEWVWLSTGVRAIDHSVEFMCAPNATPEATAAAKESLKILVPGLLACKRNMKDETAKMQCMLGANLAMTGLICKVWCGGSHGIGHQLGPIGVGHGQTSCILLPAVLKYNAKVNRTTQEEIKHLLWDEVEVGLVLKERGLDRTTSDLSDVLDVVFRELGMPRTLKEVGVGRDQLVVVADNSTRDHFCLENPIPLKSQDQIMEILEMVVGD